MALRGRDGLAVFSYCVKAFAMAAEKLDLHINSAGGGGRLATLEIYGPGDF